MRIALYIIRFLLAFLFISAGIEKLFLPYDPSVFRANAADSNPIFFEFYDMLQYAGYLYFVGFFQMLCGLLLIFRRTYLLGSIMLIPLILCLLMTHVFFSQNVFYMAFDSFVLALVLSLVLSQQKALRTLFLKPQPSWI